MNESLFETLEQWRVVDRVLLWVALVVPLAAAAGYRALRERPIVRQWRHRWIMTCILAPMPFVMWKIYNAVADHYGLESVFGMLVNTLLFGIVTVLLALVNFAVYAVLGPDSAAPTRGGDSGPDGGPDSDAGPDGAASDSPQPPALSDREASGAPPSEPS
jgi:hypothetical protein